MELRVWTHICVLIHDKGFDAYKDERLMTSGEPSTFSEDYHTLVLAGHTPMVLSSNSTLYYFSGMLADIRLFPKMLTQAEVEDVRTGVWRGEKYNFIIDNISTTNSTSNISQNFTYEELLQPQSNCTIVSFYQSLSYRDSMAVCRKYGGVLPNGDVEDTNSIFRKCNPHKALSLN